MKVQMFVVDVLEVNKAQKCYIKIGSGCGTTHISFYFKTYSTVPPRITCFE